MTKLNWMHPSYRDLLIDEIASNKPLRDTFLLTANLNDIGLALSTQGGENGKRTWPLVVDNDSKRIIEQRIRELIPELEIYEQLGLFYILETSISEKDCDKNWVLVLLYQTLLSLRNQWQGVPTSLSLLKEFCKSSLMLKPLPQLPDFEPTWNYQIKLLEKVINEGFFSGSEISDWVELISLLQNYEPRLLVQVFFPSEYLSLVSEIIKNLGNDIKSEICSPTKDEIRNEIDRINEIIDGLEKLSVVENQFKKIITPTIYLLLEKRDDLAEFLIDEEPDFEDIDDEAIDSSDFDIDQLFSDL